jgi:hypothetical protein
MSDPLKAAPHQDFRQICSDFLNGSNPSIGNETLPTIESVENGLKCVNIAYLNREGWSKREELEGQILWEMCSKRFFEIESAYRGQI